MDEMLKALMCEDKEPNLVALQNIVKVLLPWTTSKEAHERLRAVGRIRWLMELMGSQRKFQEVEEFRVLGQLVGCLTLCCAEQEQEICQSAVEGLHHLYSFMLQLKSEILMKHGVEYRQILKDSQVETAFRVTNTRNITLIFGKYFDPSEGMDFLLTAINGMRDSSVHDAVTARNMLHTILEVPGLSLWRVSEAVRSIHDHLDSISEPLARQELRRALLLLGYRFSEEVVRTLLGCSLSCDSVAAEMWKMLTSQPKTTRKILGELVSRLQEPARRRHQLSERPAGFPPLAVIDENVKSRRAKTRSLQGPSWKHTCAMLIPSLQLHFETYQPLYNPIHVCHVTFVTSRFLIKLECSANSSALQKSTYIMSIPFPLSTKLVISSKNC
ncbi:maestro heat-like repeat-containing protein family member 7 isoform X3 [Mauremys reevesii]|nr:maestro heat-like repeat-containing protein family member 7 isoform X3 [Mauremys reevesii]